MNQENLKRAREYVQANRARFSLDVLTNQLRAAGYSPDVVSVALGRQEQEAGESAGLFDFVHKKTYHSAGAKVGDFLSGFFGVFVLGFVLNAMLDFLFAFLGIFGVPYFQWIAVLGLFLGASVYLWRRRRYVAIGMLSALAGQIALLLFLEFLFLQRRMFF